MAKGYQPKEQSEFNFGIAWLQRLDELWRNADQASMQYDAFSWYQSLRTITRELYTEIDGKQEHVDNIKRLKAEIDKEMQGWVFMRAKGSNSIPPGLYAKLDTYDTLLRQIMDEGGLLTKRKEAAPRWL